MEINAVKEVKEENGAIVYYFAGSIMPEEINDAETMRGHSLYELGNQLIALIRVGLENGDLEHNIENERDER